MISENRKSSLILTFLAVFEGFETKFKQKWGKGFDKKMKTRNEIKLNL